MFVFLYYKGVQVRLQNSVYNTTEDAGSVTLCAVISENFARTVIVSLVTSPATAEGTSYIIRL